MDPRLLLVFLLAFVAAGLAAYGFFLKYQDGLQRWWEQYQARQQDSLDRARNPLTSDDFVRNQALMSAGTALVGFALGPGLLGRLFLAGLFGGMTWLAADRYLDVLWRRYLREFEEQLPDMVGVVANAVKSSFSVQQALDMVVNEFTPPMSAEVAEVMQEIQVGVAFDQALQNWVDRLRNDDLEIFCTALIIQRQTGGNLSEVLENLGQTMRERRRIQGQIRTLTTQGRFSGTILSFLPVGLYIVLYLIAPDRMGVLFTSPLGWVLIGVSAAMITTGSLIVRRIVSLDV